MLIGLDVGTTGCKAIVFDRSGEIRGYGFAEYGILSHKPGMAEQNPGEVWSTTCAVLRKAIRQSGTGDVQGLSVSVQGDAVIPVDGNFNPVYNAVLGMDYRSQRQAESCAKRLGDRKLFELTGMRPHPINTLCKVLWLKEHRREAFGNTRKMTTYADFILGKLGAEPVIDHTMASRTMAFDLKKQRWSQDILKAVEIDSDLFSRPEPSGVVVGVVGKSAAEKTGVPTQTLLVTGGHDQACAALGAGIVAPGLGVVSTGTAEVISTAFDKALLTDAMYEGYYPCYLFTKRGMYFTFSLNHVGGLLLRWFRDSFSADELREAGRQGRDAYDCMIAKVPKEPSKLMVLPHFNGSGTPWCDMDSKGAIVGLTLNTTRHDIVRAILESQAYELRINLERLREGGIEITELHAVGGGAKSATWLQIKADILGQPLHTIQTKEAACLGAAILAGSATGVFSSVEEGVRSLVCRKDTYLPDRSHAAIYNGLYEKYKSLYPALARFNSL